MTSGFWCTNIYTSHWNLYIRTIGSYSFPKTHICRTTPILERIWMIFTHTHTGKRRRRCIHKRGIISISTILKFIKISIFQNVFLIKRARELFCTLCMREENQHKILIVTVYVLWVMIFSLEVERECVWVFFENFVYILHVWSLCTWLMIWVRRKRDREPWDGFKGVWRIVIEKKEISLFS